ncbi:YcnI family copper-binding membrane protein [Pontibaca salina]|uniref:DUF1775 domain-containing protein n=1 Tax=Pontibaca salina TaxID=2795731 RepID=A0A934M1I1_9RHOB|nr:DUF1775 domain-containing protein [Pontibaca salina]MBI6630823.1 DUF1775 domain-containing protein [Pontibaca salina]
MKTILTSLVALAIAAPAAFAHVSFEMPHAAEATQKLRVKIPEGVIAVKPMPKPDWSLEIITGPYENSYDYYGTTMNEGVQELIWAGELPDAHFDQFSFRAKLTDMHAVGTTLYFPAVQECATAAERWIEIPAEGQDAHDLEGPAPGLTITAPGNGH